MDSNPKIPKELFMVFRLEEPHINRLAAQSVGMHDFSKHQLYPPFLPAGKHSWMAAIFTVLDNVSSCSGPMNDKSSVLSLARGNRNSLAMAGRADRLIEKASPKNGAGPLNGCTFNVCAASLLLGSTRTRF